MSEPQPVPESEEPIVISAEHLEPPKPLDPRIDIEKGISYFPPLTIATGVICILGFIWELASGALTDETSIMRAGALTRDAVLNHHEYWRLLSSMFLHASFDHLIGNLMALYVLGMACEHVVRISRTAIVYALTGVSGGILTIFLDERPTVGASGAIFGLLGFLLVLLVIHRKRIVLRENRIAIVLGVWAAYQLLLGFLNPMVANWAHVGGFTAGCVLATMIKPALSDLAAPAGPPGVPA